MPRELPFPYASCALFALGCAAVIATPLLLIYVFGIRVGLELAVLAVLLFALVRMLWRYIVQGRF